MPTSASANTSKTIIEIFYDFFGMDKTWSLKRNLLGGFLVHSPEYPTYFIPAFTQAKATGDAHELKKGEGPRGLLTGALEGLAVGALVSGEKFNKKHIFVCVLLGMSLQFLSSKVFPWLGEKIGRQEYKNNLKANQKNSAQNLPNPENPTKPLAKANPISTIKAPALKFSGRYNPAFNPQGSLKI